MYYTSPIWNFRPRLHESWSRSDPKSIRILSDPILIFESVYTGSDLDRIQTYLRLHEAGPDRIQNYEHARKARFWRANKNNNKSLVKVTRRQTIYYSRPIMAIEKSKKVQFSWTEEETALLLKVVLDYKVSKLAGGQDW